jgi:putative selenate reductase
MAYDNFELLRGGIRRVPGGVLQLAKAHQLANYADACNDCGNCDVFCPEDGGPFVEKPRFFGSLETYRKYAGANGFYLDPAGQRIHGTIAGEAYTLRVDPAAGRAWFADATAEIEIRLSDNQPLSWKPSGAGLPACRTLDMLPYLKLRLLLESVNDPRHVHFANVAGLEEVIGESAL